MIDMDDTDSRLDCLSNLLSNKPLIENHLVKENEVIEKLRIIPLSTLQKFGFAFYDLLRFGCLTLWFWGMARLFRNFSYRNYFTTNNIILLKQTGWLLLFPEILNVTVFTVFFANIHPVERLNEQGSTIKPFAFYNLYADIHWIIIFLALGLLILSYIFKDGLKLKEEQQLTI